MFYETVKSGETDRGQGRWRMNVWLLV